MYRHAHVPILMFVACSLLFRNGQRLGAIVGMTMTEPLPEGEMSSSSPITLLVSEHKGISTAKITASHIEDAAGDNTPSYVHVC